MERAAAIQKAVHRLACSRREQQANPECDDGGPQPFAKHESLHVARGRAERHPDADLARAARYLVGFQPVRADRREQQRQRAKRAEHRRGDADAPRRDALVALHLQRLDSRLPVFTARTMEMQRDKSITAWSVRVAATMFSTFGALALLLATIGAYGLKAYEVSRRTREIGIRMALGATAGDVQRLVLREGLRTTVIALGIGLLLAAGTGKPVDGLLYCRSPVRPTGLAVPPALPPPSPDV